MEFTLHGVGAGHVGWLELGATNQRMDKVHELMHGDGDGTSDVRDTMGWACGWAGDEQIG